MFVLLHLCELLSVYSDRGMQIQGQLDLLTFVRVGCSFWDNFLPQGYGFVVWCRL